MNTKKFEIGDCVIYKGHTRGVISRKVVDHYEYYLILNTEGVRQGAFSQAWPSDLELDKSIIRERKLQQLLKKD